MSDNWMEWWDNFGKQKKEKDDPKDNEVYYPTHKEKVHFSFIKYLVNTGRIGG